MGYFSFLPEFFFSAKRQASFSTVVPFFSCKDEKKTAERDPSPQVRVRMGEDERLKQAMEDVRDSLPPKIVPKYESRSKFPPQMLQQDRLTKEAFVYDPEVGYQVWSQEKFFLYISSF